VEVINILIDRIENKFEHFKFEDFQKKNKLENGNLSDEKIKKN
jgi:hypothetical protein